MANLNLANLKALSAVGSEFVFRVYPLPQGAKTDTCSSYWKPLEAPSQPAPVRPAADGPVPPGRRRARRAGVPEPRQSHGPRPTRTYYFSNQDSRYHHDPSPGRGARALPAKFSGGGTVTGTVQPEARPQ